MAWLRLVPTTAGERFGAPRLAGMVLVLLGLVLIVTAHSDPSTDPATASR